MHFPVLGGNVFPITKVRGRHLLKINKHLEGLILDETKCYKTPLDWYIPNCEILSKLLQLHLYMRPT